MKSSELKKHIKEFIISELSEVSKEDIKNQQDLNKELEKTVQLQKQYSDISKQSQMRENFRSSKLNETKNEIKYLIKKYKSSNDSSLIPRIKKLNEIYRELKTNI
jgi:hypothetical protein